MKKERKKEKDPRKIQILEKAIEETKKAADEILHTSGTV